MQAKRNRRSETEGWALRASNIEDIEVLNAAHKKLGTVEDLMINSRTGRVVYAALSYGGFAGVGDKLFAVPWRAFKFERNKQEKENMLVLNIDEQTLKNAPGFDKEHWPNFADPKFRKGIESYYGRTEGSTAAVDGKSGVDVHAGSVQVEVKTRREGAGEGAQRVAYLRQRDS